MDFEAIGTRWSITSNQDLRPVQKKIMARIDAFDMTYSRFKKDSWIMQSGAKVGTYRVPPDAELLLDFYKKLYVLTNGLVTPLIGQTLQQAGYDASYSFEVKEVTVPPAWDEALAYEFPNLEIKKPVVLDFGAAGKGYLVDIIGELLKVEGFTDFCINAGGDLLVFGGAQRVGLEHPDDVTQAIGVVELEAGALCGSAGNRRRWATYHHTINPKTLRSPEAIKAIWVQAKTAMLADGLTTALYFMEPAVLRKHFPFEYAMIKGEEVMASAGFKAEFF